MTTDAVPPAVPDASERQRIVEELDATLFVEAGAGSGKTRSLVERIAALVTVAGVPMREIAAITFTDKAAAELRDRVRQQLEAITREGEPLAATRATDALTELDGAAVCTLHAFAQRLLIEHPLAAGMPPRVEVADELSSQLAFEERWGTFLGQLVDVDSLAANPDDELTIVVLLEARRFFESLRDIAVEFDRNWDLVADQVAGRPVPPVPTIDVAPLVTDLVAVAAERRFGTPGDRLVTHLAKLEDGATRLAEAESTVEQVRALSALAELAAGNQGSKANWKGSLWQNDLDPLRRRADDAAGACHEAFQQVIDVCLRRVASRLAALTLEAAEERRRNGRLAFHDLLVLARAVLQDADRGPATRAVLRTRYTRLLLDEFQDTDPIQVDIARLLAADPDDASGQPERGRLFFVGDPKQSIYRFRRADIATFLATRDEVTDDPVRLTANFRTTEPVIAWVNAVFAQLITEVPQAQPAYQPLVAQRQARLAGPAVSVFDAEHQDGPLAAELRVREVSDVVAAIRAAVGHWEVEDGGAVRPALFGDIAILLPARTVLPALEDALDQAGIPYRTESSSLAYASREARDVLLTLKAIADPSDELALVSALRSPLFGCSDVDLYRWHVERHGRWDVLAGQLPPRDDHDDPVHDALTWLGAVAADRHWASPAELLDRVVRERRMLEVAGAGRRARDVWRRLRYLVDQARAWREAGGGTLRDYLAWASRQASDGVRVTEAVLPETDHDAVRIMTIHAAKGLEFPIVILAGLTTRPQRTRRGVNVLWAPSGPEFRFDDTFATKDYEVTRALDEQLDEHERRRLLYVACTRARDHLVVSRHRRATTKAPTTLSLAELLAGASHGLGLHEVFDPAEHGRGLQVAPPTPPTPAAFSLESWQADQHELLTRAGRPRTVSATSVAGHQFHEPRAEDDPGLAKGGVDLDLPPWQKGRYGTAIGRAVHAVLQTIDLATGDGVEAAAAAQAAAEGVQGREATIAALARSALAAPAVQEAVASTSWREVLVAAPVGDRLLEGYLDLLYRGDDGLVVVDYKTDQITSDADRDARVDRYRLQLGAYALAVEQVTGEPVRRAVLVFCSPIGPATQVEVPHLEAAMADVAGRIAGSTGETPPPLLA